MKKLIMFMTCITLGVVCLAQAPQAPRTISVKGDFSGITNVPNPDGTTETVIACVCTANTCYTITVNGVAPSSGDHLESDCAATGVDLIPIGSNIDLKLNDGTLLIQGDLVSFSNYPTGGNPLNRSSKFILAP
jgi:hypothetical protein